MSTEKTEAMGIDALLPWDGPAILLLDLDAFFASVAQLDNPEWRGKPVIVGGDSTRRGVVSTCSYEARKFGVRSAMPSAQAVRLCPDAIWTPGDFPRYRELSAQVMEIMTTASPLLQQVSIDEAFLDVSPGRFVKQHPIQLANRIREEVSRLGITCSIGLGTSKSVAKIASDMDKPNGLTVIYPGQELAFLSPLPIRSLSGVGRQAEKRLHSFGIFTLGDMADADESVLKGIYGKNADMMRNRCLGLDASPVQAEDEIKSVSNELTFLTDLTTREEIEQAVAMLSAKVGRRLRHKNLAGYTVGLKVRYADLSFANVQHTLDHAVDDEQVFAPLLKKLVEQVWQSGMRLRLVGVSVSSFGERPEQLSLFGDELVDLAVDETRQKEHTRSLVEATDKVKDRFGEHSVGYGRELRFRDRDTGNIAQKKDEY
jgi:DNA polymerase-4